MNLAFAEYKPVRWIKLSLWSIIAFCVFALPAVWLVTQGYILPLIIYISIPIIVLLINLPHLSLKLFIAVNFIYAPYFMTGYAIHPWDIAALIFLFACAISWLLKVSPCLDKTPFDISLGMLTLATLLSGLFAFEPSLSIIPLIRIIMIYLTFRAVYYLLDNNRIINLVRYYIFIYTAVSFYHVILFLTGEGAFRIFGFSGIGFETFAMIGVPLTLTLAIWSPSSRERKIYSLFIVINVLALLATMSRGPILTVIVAVTFLIIISWRKAKKQNIRYAKKNLRWFIGIIIPLFLIILLSSGYFLYLGSRFEELSEGASKGTILLRVSLWKAAWQSFLLNPLTGIGVGNFRIIDDLLPQLKFDPVRYYLVGTSFHNVFLHYLAETGIIGALALLFLAYKILSSGYRNFNRTIQSSDLTMAMVSYVSAFIIFITIFYMRVWTWGQEGYMLAFLLAIIGRQFNELKYKNETAQN
jgi:O-antigen ligase